MWKRFKYKNIFFFLLSLIIAIIIFRQQVVHSFLLSLGDFGYLGAFIGGILFVSTFTVATGILILITLAGILSPIEIGIVAGFGAVIGDLTIFHFVKNNLSNELTELYDKIDKNHYVASVFHTKYFSWTLPVIGALIIASPFPDEVGVSLMGISKMKTYQFLIASFFLNAIGIFLVVSAALAVKP